MKRGVVGVMLFFSLGGSAAAASRVSAHLTLRHAKAAIRANDHADRPARVTFARCRRLNDTTITCWTVEQAAHTLMLDNGSPVVGNLGAWETAQLRGRRVHVTSSL